MIISIIVNNSDYKTYQRRRNKILLKENGLKLLTKKVSIFIVSDVIV